ncbi:MAG: hypothetical protein AMJ73_05115 [candidate division Zixibacteria bacterium SM1_73]|nr:MAG: hypothetical protein AMJ73_05115 [candidate division Zixibacteria bacterium SM1_73]
MEKWGLFLFPSFLIIKLYEFFKPWIHINHLRNIDFFRQATVLYLTFQTQNSHIQRPLFSLGKEDFVFYNTSMQTIETYA